MTMVNRAAVVLLIPGTLITAACGTLARRAETYEVGSRWRGVASWYGEDYHGRPTASGEIYDMYGLTAAHRTMPLRSIILVKNRKNGRTVTLRVNDRGPFIHGRVLDVSYGAAEALGFVKAGLAPVEFEVIGRTPRSGRPTSPPLVAGAAGSEPFAVQVGAFTDKENADHLKARLESRYRPVRILRHQTNSLTYYRVRVGAFTSAWQAEQVARRLETSEDGLDGFVTRLDD